jgi:hypothetical protein
MRTDAIEDKTSGETLSAEAETAGTR